jgi:hypothetical protein
MSRLETNFPPSWSMGDLLKHFGGIAPERIRLNPPPGTATERHVTELNDHEDKLYELVDGVLVEKVLGAPESYVAVEIASELRGFVKKHKLGIVLGADGTLRLMPGLVRIPDVAFISFDRLPGRRVPVEAIPDLARFGHRSVEQGEHQTRNGAKTQRLFLFRRPPRLVRQSQETNSRNLHFSRSGRNSH